MANQRIYLTAPGVKRFCIAKRMGSGFYAPVSTNEPEEAAAHLKRLNAWFDEVTAIAGGQDVIDLEYEIEREVPSRGHA